MKVGDKLYFVGREYHSNVKGDYVTVTKIGRRWVYLSNDERIDKETMTADGVGYASPGRCYASKAEYDAEIACHNAHSDLYRKLSHRPREGVTLDDVLQAAKLLGVDITGGGE